MKKDKENFYKLYLDFKNFYETSKDAALVKKDLEIEEGVDKDIAEKEYNENIKRLDLQLKTIDSFMYYIVQNLGAHHSDNLDIIMQENIFKIYRIQVNDL